MVFINDKETAVGFIADGQDDLAVALKTVVNSTYDFDTDTVAYEKELQVAGIPLSIKRL